MEIIITKNYNLRRLHYWLKYQLSGAALLFLSWLGGIVILLAALAALIFTPYMLTILFKEKKFGWITFFFIFVIAPTAIIPLFIPRSIYSDFLYLVPLVFFYFYCFLLRLTIYDWLR